MSSLLLSQSDLDDPTLLLMNTRQNELVLEFQRQMESANQRSLELANQRSLESSQRRGSDHHTRSLESNSSANQRSVKNDDSSICILKMCES